MIMGKWRVKLLARWFGTGFVTVLWALTLLPFVWIIAASLKGQGELFQLPMHLLPEAGWQWQNYGRVFTRLQVWRLLLNSALVGTAVVLGQVATATVTGYVLARRHYAVNRVMTLVLLTGLLVPIHLTLIPSFRLLSLVGLTDTLGALTVPFLAGALGILIMVQQFKVLPRELEEAAWLDGCTDGQLFWYVLLPSITPGLRAVAVIAFLFSWNDLMWPLLMTHSPAVRTVPVGLALLQDEISTQWELLMAGSVLTTLPALVVLGYLTGGFRQLGVQIYLNSR